MPLGEQTRKRTASNTTGTVGRKIGRENPIFLRNVVETRETGFFVLNWSPARPILSRWGPSVMAESLQDVAPWLRTAREGSPEALGEALEACRTYLLLIANRELDPQVQAKGGASDLVQETFLEAQRDLSAFRGKSEAEWRAWLREMLLHNLANFSRRYRDTDKREVAREVAVVTSDGSMSGWCGEYLPADTPSPSMEAMAHERADALAAALERLPVDYRLVIGLRYQEGRTFAEIAQAMQRSENAVRKLWFRAIERLQEELETQR
jgi:RNA polymerase sigma-70 factor (ECF subfamily)